ncbi:MAG: Gfo/Idh/MocA family protein [Candidatus Sumerlaeaceae bacterium]|jgi:predicted dehydrogenase
MGKRHRIAVIGCGDMGSAHVRGFAKLENCEVVATVDPDPNALRRYGVEWYESGPPHFLDTQTMLRSVKPDACVIAVPDRLHRPVAEMALEAGCDIFLEKPVATSIEDCDAILAAAKQAGRILQIGLVYRYATLYRRMTELAHLKKAPALFMWCKELRQPFPQKPWFYSQEATGGTIVEKDCHHFDIFNWMIGSPPLRVVARGGQHVLKSGTLVTCDYCPDPPRVIEQIDTVDHAMVIVEYANGARAALLLCMYLQPHNVMPEGLEIGALFADGSQMCAYRDTRLGCGGAGEPWREEVIDPVLDSEGLGHIGCQRQRREFLRCLETREEPAANGAVGRSSLVVALAAERSIRENRVVELTEFAKEGSHATA